MTSNAPAALANSRPAHPADPGASAAAAPALPYHLQMRRSPDSAKWWRPLASLGIVLGFATAAALVMLLVAVAWLLLNPWAGASENLEDPTNPWDMLLLLGPMALLLPMAVLGSRWGGTGRGRIHSVLGRVRWGMLLRAGAFVLPVYAVIIVGGFLLSPPEDFARPEAGARTAAVFAIAILLAPLQCAAEEYLFRGLPLQAFGTWLRSPLWGVLLPIPLFMLGHGYHWAGQIDIAVFALCMGALAWKSGGLELPIVMHASNNLVLFMLAPFSPSSLHQGEVDPAGLLFSLPLTIGMTAVLWVWVSRREGVRLREPVRG